MNNAAQTANQAEDADEARTKRLFVGVFASLLGVEQNYITDDGRVIGPVNQFTIANPDGGAAVVGQPISNTNTVSAVGGIPIGWLMLAGVAWLLMRR